MLTYRNDQEWRTRAECRGTDPELWDTPSCLRQNNIDSALARDSGVIRAGIPISTTGGVGRLRSWKALQMIAETGDIDAGWDYAFADYGLVS